MAARERVLVIETIPIYERDIQLLSHFVGVLEELKTYLGRPMKDVDAAIHRVDQHAQAFGLGLKRVRHLTADMDMDLGIALLEKFLTPILLSTNFTGNL